MAYFEDMAQQMKHMSPEEIAQVLRRVQPGELASGRQRQDETWRDQPAMEGRPLRDSYGDGGRSGRWSSREQRERHKNGGRSDRNRRDDDERPARPRRKTWNLRPRSRGGKGNNPMADRSRSDDYQRSDRDRRGDDQRTERDRYQGDQRSQRGRNRDERIFHGERYQEDAGEHRVRGEMRLESVDDHFQQEQALMGSHDILGEQELLQRQLQMERSQLERPELLQGPPKRQMLLDQMQQQRDLDLERQEEMMYGSGGVVDEDLLRERMLQSRLTKAMESATSQEQRSLFAARMMGMVDERAMPGPSDHVPDVDQPSHVPLEQVIPPHLLGHVSQIKQQLQQGNAEMDPLEILAQLGRQLKEQQQGVGVSGQQHGFLEGHGDGPQLLEGQAGGHEDQTEILARLGRQFREQQQGEGISNQQPGFLEGQGHEPQLLQGQAGGELLQGQPGGPQLVEGQLGVPLLQGQAAGTSVTMPLVAGGHTVNMSGAIPPASSDALQAVSVDNSVTSVFSKHLLPESNTTQSSLSMMSLPQTVSSVPHQQLQGIMQPAFIGPSNEACPGAVATMAPFAGRGGQITQDKPTSLNSDFYQPDQPTEDPTPHSYEDPTPHSYGFYLQDTVGLKERHFRGYFSQFGPVLNVIDKFRYAFVEIGNLTASQAHKLVGVHHIEGIRILAESSEQTDAEDAGDVSQVERPATSQSQTAQSEPELQIIDIKSPHQSLAERRKSRSPGKHSSSRRRSRSPRRRRSRSPGRRRSPPARSQSRRSRSPRRRSLSPRRRSRSPRRHAQRSCSPRRSHTPGDKNKQGQSQVTTASNKTKPNPLTSHPIIEPPEQKSTEINLETTPKGGDEANNWKCHVCNVVCEAKWSWDSHVKGARHRKRLKQKSIEENKIYCEPCNVTCDDQKSYDAHVKTMDHEVTVKYKEVVDERQAKEARENKVTSQAAGTLTWRCDICDMSFKEQAKLDFHRKSISHMIAEFRWKNTGGKNVQGGPQDKVEYGTDSRQGGPMSTMQDVHQPQQCTKCRQLYTGDHKCTTDEQQKKGVRKLVVYNQPRFSQEHLQQYFSTFGTIEKMNLAKENTLAFVHYEYVTDAKAAFLAGMDLLKCKKGRRRHFLGQDFVDVSYTLHDGTPVVGKQQLPAPAFLRPAMGLAGPAPHAPMGYGNQPPGPMGFGGPAPYPPVDVPHMRQDPTQSLAQESQARSPDIMEIEPGSPDVMEIEPLPPGMEGQDDDPQKTGVSKKKTENTSKKSQEEEVVPKLFIWGFGQRLADQDLYDHFKRFGKLRLLNIVKGKGYGFVTYARLASFKAAFNAGRIDEGISYQTVKGVEFMSKQNTDQPRKGRPAFLKIFGFSNSITWEDIREYFVQFGKLVQCYLQSERGVGHLEFEDAAAAQEVLRSGDDRRGATCHLVKGEMVYCQDYNDKQIPSRSGKILRLEGLWSEMTQEDLKDYFERYGEVVDVRVIPNKSFGHVEFRRSEGAQRAMDRGDRVCEGISKHYIRGKNFTAQLNERELPLGQMNKKPNQSNKMSAEPDSGPAYLDLTAYTRPEQLEHLGWQRLVNALLWFGFSEGALPKNVIHLSRQLFATKGIPYEEIREDFFSNWKDEEYPHLIEPQFLDLTKITSVSQLEELGLLRVRAALKALGLKTGGYLTMAAERLFATKGVPRKKLPESFFPTRRGQKMTRKTAQKRKRENQLDTKPSPPPPPQTRYASTTLQLGQIPKVAKAPPTSLQDMSFSAPTIDQHEPPKLFISGFGHRLADWELRNHFKQYGKLRQMNIRKDKGYGYVGYFKMSSHMAAMNAGRIEEGISYHTVKGVEFSCKNDTDEPPKDYQSNYSEANQSSLWKYYVANIDDLMEDDLREYFVRFGPVAEVAIVRNANEKWYGLVRFETLSQEQESRFLGEHNIRGRCVHVFSSNNKDPNIRPSETQSLPPANPEDTKLPRRRRGNRFHIVGVKHLIWRDIRDYFSQFGTVVQAMTSNDKGMDHLDRPYGHVSFDGMSREDEERMLWRMHTISGVEVMVQRSKPKGLTGTKRFHLKGLRNLTGLDIGKYFSKYGEIVDVTMSGTKGYNRPYGFIEYVDLTDEEEADVLGKHVIKKVAVQVDRSREKGQQAESSSDSAMHWDPSVESVQGIASSDLFQGSMHQAHASVSYTTQAEPTMYQNKQSDSCTTQSEPPMYQNQSSDSYTTQLELLEETHTDAWDQIAEVKATLPDKKSANDEEEEVDSIVLSSISRGLTEDDMRKHFSKFGKIKELKVMQTKTLSFGYVRFTTQEAADKALRAGAYLRGQWGVTKMSVKGLSFHCEREVDAADVEDEEETEKGNPNNILQVMKMPEDTESFKDKVHQHFAQYGQVLSTRWFFGKNLAKYTERIWKTGNKCTQMLIEFEDGKGVEEAMKAGVVPEPVPRESTSEGQSDKGDGVKKSKVDASGDVVMVEEGDTKKAETHGDGDEDKTKVDKETGQPWKVYHEVDGKEILCLPFTGDFKPYKTKEFSMLFIRNIGDEITERDLTKYFKKKFGAVFDVMQGSVSESPNNGVGLVFFNSTKSVEKVMKLQGADGIVKLMVKNSLLECEPLYRDEVPRHKLQTDTVGKLKRARILLNYLRAHCHLCEKHLPPGADKKKWQQHFQSRCHNFTSKYTPDRAECEFCMIQFETSEQLANHLRTLRHDVIIKHQDILSDDVGWIREDKKPTGKDDKETNLLRVFRIADGVSSDEITQYFTRFGKILSSHWYLSKKVQKKEKTDGEVKLNTQMQIEFDDYESVAKAMKVAVKNRDGFEYAEDEMFVGHHQIRENTFVSAHPIEDDITRRAKDFRTLFIRTTSADITQGDLTARFSMFGEIELLLLGNPINLFGVDKRHGIVIFKSTDAMREIRKQQDDNGRVKLMVKAVLVECEAVSSKEVFFPRAHELDDLRKLPGSKMALEVLRRQRCRCYLCFFVISNVNSDKMFRHHLQTRRHTFMDAQIKEPHVCKPCMIVFSNGQQLINHEKTMRHEEVTAHLDFIENPQDYEEKKDTQDEVKVDDEDQLLPSKLPIYCSACQKWTNSEKDFKAHANGNSHKKAINRWDSSQQLARSARVEKLCKLCEIVLPNAEIFQDHLLSWMHKSNIKDSKVVRSGPRCVLCELDFSSEKVYKLHVYQFKEKHKRIMKAKAAAAGGKVWAAAAAAAAKPSSVESVEGAGSSGGLSIGSPDPVKPMQQQGQISATASSTGPVGGQTSGLTGGQTGPMGRQASGQTGRQTGPVGGQASGQTGRQTKTKSTFSAYQEKRDQITEQFEWSIPDILKENPNWLGEVKGTEFVKPGFNCKVCCKFCAWDREKEGSLSASRSYHCADQEHKYRETMTQRGGGISGTIPGVFCDVCQEFFGFDGSQFADIIADHCVSLKHHLHIKLYRLKNNLKLPNWLQNPPFEANIGGNSSQHKEAPTAPTSSHNYTKTATLRSDTSYPSKPATPKFNTGSNPSTTGAIPSLFDVVVDASKVDVKSLDEKASAQPKVQTTTQSLYASGLKAKKKDLKQTHSKNDREGGDGRERQGGDGTWDNWDSGDYSGQAQQSSSYGSYNEGRDQRAYTSDNPQSGSKATRDVNYGSHAYDGGRSQRSYDSNSSQSVKSKEMREWYQSQVKDKKQRTDDYTSGKRTLDGMGYSSFRSVSGNDDGGSYKAYETSAAETGVYGDYEQRKSSNQGDYGRGSGSSTQHSIQQGSSTGGNYGHNDQREMSTQGDYRSSTSGNYRGYDQRETSTQGEYRRGSSTRGGIRQGSSTSGDYRNYEQRESSTQDDYRSGSFSHGGFRQGSSTSGGYGQESSDYSGYQEYSAASSDNAYQESHQYPSSYQGYQ